MPCCAAPNCSRRSEKGARLFRFPMDPERRERWTINSRRDNWQPTPTARLCEVHFEEDQFESRRADGWRKLKPNAIPTKFNVPTCPKPLALKRKTPHQRENVPYCTADSQFNTQRENRRRRPNTLRRGGHVKNHDILVEPKLEVDETQFFDHSADRVDVPDDSVDVKVEVPDEETNSSHEEDETSANLSRHSAEALAAAEEKIKFLQTKVWMLQKKLTSANKKVNECKNVLNKFPFLNADQVEILTSGRNLVSWSPESIKQAEKIRSVIGWKGYRYLLKLKLPLPSYSTLCRKRQLNVVPKRYSSSSEHLVHPGKESV